MNKEKTICVTKNSINHLIGILDEKIRVLKVKGSKQILSEEEYDMLADTRYEMITYLKVKDMMEENRSDTLCMMIPDIKPAIKKEH